MSVADMCAAAPRRRCPDPTAQARPACREAALASPRSSAPGLSRAASLRCERSSALHCPALCRASTRGTRVASRREGVGQETGNKVFDPLGFSKIASDETMAWFRAAELKHSRVAMAAATGWAYVSSGGPLLPGYISPSTGATFESLGRDGYAAWDATPAAGKLQIIGIIGLLELLGEAATKVRRAARRPPRATCAARAATARERRIR